MKRPGFEADRFALMSMDVGSGQAREIAAHWDRSADNIVLSEDGEHDLHHRAGHRPASACSRSTSPPARPSRSSATAPSPTFEIAGQTLAFTRNTLKTGDQLFTTTTTAGAPLRAITPSAGETAEGRGVRRFRAVRVQGLRAATPCMVTWSSRGTTWKGKKYPVAFLIHGGPQGSFGNGWSYRWNPQTYAGQGYAVVMIDFHGSTGYGQAFTDAISQHWGGRRWRTCRRAGPRRRSNTPSSTATTPARSARATAATWSTGSPATGNAAPERGSAWSTTTASSTRASMGYATEELWFTEWENGGTPYENPKATRSSTRSTMSPIGACRCWWCRAARTSAFPMEQGSVRVHRAAAQGHRVEVAVLPRREPLGAEAAEQRAVARHGQWLAEAASRPVTLRNPSPIRAAGPAGGADSACQEPYRCQSKPPRLPPR